MSGTERRRRRTSEFTIAGEFNGRPAEVTWRAGEIHGDEEVVACIQRLVEARSTVEGPVPSAFSAALRPSWLAALTIFSVFDGGADFSKGRASDPPWFSDPPGTIY